MWIEVEALKDHSDISAEFRDVRIRQMDRGSIYYDFALLNRLQPVDAADQRALAGTGWTTNYDNLPPGNFKIDSPENVKFPEPFVHIAEFYDGSLKHLAVKGCRKRPIPRQSATITRLGGKKIILDDESSQFPQLTISDCRGQTIHKRLQRTLLFQDLQKNQ